jgi:beta-phosphoglucomutase-like phosphatase (HAD superfamily)
MKYKAAIFDMDGLICLTQKGFFLDAFMNTCADLAINLILSLFIMYNRNKLRQEQRDILTEDLAPGLIMTGSGKSGSGMLRHILQPIPYQ